MPQVTQGQTALGIVQGLGITPQEFLKYNPDFAATGGKNDSQGLTGNIRIGQNYNLPTPVTPTTTGAIAVDTLNPGAKPVTLATPASPDPNEATRIMAEIQAKQLQIQQQMQADAAKPKEDPMATLLKKYYEDEQAAFDAKPKEADLYQQAQQEVVLQEKNRLVNDLTGQLNAITAGTKADALRLPSEGISAGAIQGRNISNEREAAIRALPISAQLQAAQGNLAMAKDDLNTLFSLRSKDAESAYNFQSDLRKSVYDVATAEQRRLLDQQDKEDERKFTLYRDNTKALQDLANTAIESGQSSLLGQIGSIDPSSPSFAQDIAKIQGQIKPKEDPNAALDTQYKQLQIAKLTQDINSSGSDTGGQSVDNIIAYAQQYASTGMIPTGLPKGTFGVVSQVAKDLPKTDGEIVDNNTNIKSSKLGATKADGLAAMRDLTIKVDQAKNLFTKLNTGLLGGLLGNTFPTAERQNYNILKGEIVDLLSRARSGAALTETEIAEYQKKLPGTFNKTLFLGKSGDVMLDGLKKSIADKLDTSLKAQGVSMYGFSKINIGGEQYTVGDIINVNGSQGRINPDGSITPIN